MDKQEFLNELRSYLQGMDNSEINEIISFYDNYINEELSKGKTMSQIIDDIGTPRLLSKTIMQSKEKKKTYAYSEQEYSHTDNDNTQYGRQLNTIDFSKWYVKLGIISGLILVAIIIFAIVIGLFTIAIKIAIPAIAIFIIYVLIKNLLNR